MKERGDCLQIRCADIKFGHPAIGTAILYDHRDRFAVLVIENRLRAQQIRPALAAARIRSMAKTAIYFKKLLSPIDCRRICWRMDRIC